MVHVAIMKKSWHLIEKILSGEKKIESRWYQTKRAPWDKVGSGDTVYFKNSGEQIMASAKISKVLQFKFGNEKEVEMVVNKYGKEICLIDNDVKNWKQKPKYAILMYLEAARKVSPFKVNKKGFGCACAWMSFENNNIFSYNKIK